MLVVTLKYVVLILRADNRGEGGIMALTALAAQAAGETPRRRRALLLLGVFGAALFYGDSVITPAISVLSAVEGLEVVTPASSRRSCRSSIGVLVGLFVDPAPRHRRGRQAVRPGHRRCGSSCWPRRRAADRARSRRSWRRSIRCHAIALPARTRLALVRRHRRDRARADRRRGAVRGHGPLRQAADPARLARPGAAGARR